MFTHKIFLLWLLYAVVVIFTISALYHLGLPQLALHYDRSYLTYLLFGMYGIAEILSGRQAWLISQENYAVDRVIKWLSTHQLRRIATIYQVQLSEDTDVYDVSTSVIGDHIGLLCAKSHAGQRQISQGTIIDVTATCLYERALIADFIAARIVWVGILATIIGVIMAFWPMIDGVSIDAMKSNIGLFFGGIAVAFIPTAVSFVCKIILDCNTWIIASGVHDLMDKIVCVSETKIIPFLELYGWRGGLLTK